MSAHVAPAAGSEGHGRFDLAAKDPSREPWSKLRGSIAHTARASRREEGSARGTRLYVPRSVSKGEEVDLRIWGKFAGPIERNCSLALGVQDFYIDSRQMEAVKTQHFVWFYYQPAARPEHAGAMPIPYPHGPGRYENGMPRRRGDFG